MSGRAVRDVLICGASVAGPTLAWWLKHHGLNPTLVEMERAQSAVELVGLG